MLVLFLDESGDHNLVKIQNDYPVFVLGGVILDEEHERATIEPELVDLKRELFGNGHLVLHTADIARNRNGFEALASAQTRNHFYTTLNSAMRRWDYKVVACAIRKEQHRDRYGNAAIDPYELSLTILLERFCFELEESGEKGYVVAESRNPTLDRQLQLAFEAALLKGTPYVKGARLRACLDRRLYILPKASRRSGLELADLVVTPVGRHVLGKPPKDDWTIVQEKLRRIGNRWEGPGLVVLPK